MTEDRNEVRKMVKEVLQQYLKKPLIIAGNWKMHMTILAGKQFLKEMEEVKTPHTLLIFPPYTSLEALAPDFNRTGISFGSQNFHEEEKGAYTGEISLPMIKEIGCGYVLAGHSERRSYYNETDEAIAKKAAAAVRNGLHVMVCIGELLQDRKNGNWKDVLKNQIVNDLREVSKEDLKFVSLAYEPVWAIGTGESATAGQILETHSYIKDVLKEIFGCSVPVLYGGSVNEKNACEIGKLDNVDGFLIGGASLKVEKFKEIIWQTEGKS